MRTRAGWARLVVVAAIGAGAAACGARSEPVGEGAGRDAAPRDAAGDAGMDLAPLGLSAAFSVSLNPENEATSNSVRALFWSGDTMPAPGGRGGRSLQLDPGESITLNGTRLTESRADWALLYVGASLPEPADGRWVFALTRRGRTVTVTVEARRSRFVGFPEGRVSLAPGVTLRWAPPFPAASTRRAYLTSCVLTDAAEVGVESVTLRGRLSATPCMSTAQVYATTTVPLGPPFEGGSASTSVAIVRPIVLVP